MKTAISAILAVFLFTSCLKNEETGPEIIIDPPFEKYKYFWGEIEKKEGTGNWEPISGGNMLRLYTDDLDTASRMIGQYAYKATNAKINIPENRKKLYNSLFCLIISE